MTKTQVTANMQAAVNVAIATLARVHGVSLQTIGQAIERGDERIMGQMAELFERMEQSL